MRLIPTVLSHHLCAESHRTSNQECTPALAGEAPSPRGGREILCVCNSFFSPGPALGPAQGKGGRLDCSVLWLCPLPCYFGFLCARYHHTSLQKREIICLCSSGWELGGGLPLLQRPGSTSPVPHGFSRALAGNHCLMFPF